jgi:hypothetical protein
MVCAVDPKSAEWLVWYVLAIEIFIHAIDVIVMVEQDAKFTKKEIDEEWGDNRGEKPEGFEWEANGTGRISVTPHVTDLDFTVEGYHFKAHLTKEVRNILVVGNFCNFLYKR